MNWKKWDYAKDITDKSLKINKYMLQLQITYKDGEIRNITNDLNYDQFRALVEHVEKGNGKMAEFKEIKITRK